MSILAWIILGVIAGFVGSKIVNRTGVTGLNLYSLLVAVIGAVVVLLAYHAMQRIA